ncbi:MAG: galactokinase [Treponema sp.]|nr:galactokinase [Treponema sp.]
MNEKELAEKLNSAKAAEIFTELYGGSGLEAARKRYAALITDMLKDGNEWGDLRIFSAPGRTELAGNHTDHNRGKVLAASIQLDSAAVVKKRKDNIVFFRSTGFPDVEVKLTDSYGDPDLEPKPEEKGTTEALVRGIAAEFHKRGCKIGGFSANADSIVFPGSGLSSSAAVEVLFGKIFDSLYGGGKRTPLEIAQIGQIAENVYFGKPCGLMDQTACASGGAVAIDFEFDDEPVLKQINFDLAAAGFVLCVVNTGGSHADLTADYASIPSEMKSVAAFYGKTVLRELNKEAVLYRAIELRKKLGDRALLRAIHYFDENERVYDMSIALQIMGKEASDAARMDTFYYYLKLVNQSGDSSWKLLQNVYSPNNTAEQGMTIALSLTKDFLSSKCSNAGACRVHGGGFAGTIQAYIPVSAINDYRDCIEEIFGAGSVTQLFIRPKGAIELIL